MLKAAYDEKYEAIFFGSEFCAVYWLKQLKNRAEGEKKHLYFGIKSEREIVWLNISLGGTQ